VTLKSRNLICAAFAVLCVVVVGANAEVHENAVGAHVAYGTLFEVELDYQKKIGKDNRLELGLSYGYDPKYSGSYYGSGVGVSYGFNWICAVGYYQWHWDVKDSKGLGFFVGPGANMGIFTWSYELNGLYFGNQKFSYTGFSMSIGGEAGVEYDLNVSGTPLLLSLDIRPMVGLVNSYNFNFLVGLAGRYTF
jgi:hypothetical protein